MTSRREFLTITAAAALGHAFGVTGVRAAGAPLRILILGGTGFIGPHLVHAALARGHHVAMLNRGQRQPGENRDDFANVEAIRGDRTQPTAYDGVKNRTWDAVIDTATNLVWTREAAQALRSNAGRYMYVSSTGVFFPYRTVDIPEDGPVLLTDTPPQDPPSYGVLKAQSENIVRDAFGDRALLIRPSYIVGPGDPTDRFTYWPVRIARGGEVLIPGKKTDLVQYTDVRDLATFMIQLFEKGAGGTFNTTGPEQKQTMEQFVNGLAPLARTPVSYTWIEDYQFLREYPLRTAPNGRTSGLTYSIPWVLPEGDALGHVRIDNRKAVAAGLKCRPLIEIGRDTVAWRAGPSVPAAIRDQPRYVITDEQERAMLAAWKARHG